MILRTVLLPLNRYVTFPIPVLRCLHILDNEGRGFHRSRKDEKSLVLVRDAHGQAVIADCIGVVRCIRRLCGA